MPVLGRSINVSMRSGSIVVSAWSIGRYHYEPVFEPHMHPVCSQNAPEAAIKSTMLLVGRS